MAKKIFIILFLILAISLGFYFLNQPKDTPSKPAPQPSAEQNFLLTDYPLQTIPLYQMIMVSASKFFVNDDPVNSAGYFGQPVNYYNVVFETEATASELLNYYRSLMTETNPDLVSDERVEGKIGQYKVSASHYGNNPKNYAYLQVYLPQEDYQKTNPYYSDYPNIVEIDPSWVEHENSYGLLNQNDGEIEYTQYFNPTTEEGISDDLATAYQNKYQSEQNFKFNPDTGLMTWTKDDYSIYLTFSQDHGRIYLMIRRPL